MESYPSLKEAKLAVIGAGNIGLSMVKGFVLKGVFSKEEIILARPDAEVLLPFSREGYQVSYNNGDSIKMADMVLLAVRPHILPLIAAEVAKALKPGQLLISVVSGVTCPELKAFFPMSQNVRIMPNIAAAVGESMTTICSDDSAAAAKVVELYQKIGSAIIIEESQMTAATALVGSGIAFFLRAIRAAAQGGTEIGFHAEEAQLMVSQVAKGAAALLITSGGHAEAEIDKVTTPKGCTIAGLNAMERAGFSSAMTSGVLAAAESAANLYQKK